ncbi:hypothetical protein [Streptomyces rimosus]|uniref:hypothetical protein n=1 Tax=Streptomyces rimosus TaxID=1927 RepID=UPI0037D62F69
MPHMDDAFRRRRAGEARFGTVRAWLGGSAMVRLAPLSPDQWRHLTPSDAITLHEGQPVLGTATITEVAPPRI